MSRATCKGMWRSDASEPLRSSIVTMPAIALQETRHLNSRDEDDVLMIQAKVPVISLHASLNPSSRQAEWSNSPRATWKRSRRTAKRGGCC